MCVSLPRQDYFGTVYLRGIGYKLFIYVVCTNLEPALFVHLTKKL